MDFDKEFWEDEVKRNGGRYQLTVAPSFIANRANAEVESMRYKLFIAAAAGELRVYERGMDEVYRFTPNWKSDVQLKDSEYCLKDSEIYLEAYWHDLNAWLEIKERVIFEIYQFPKPDAPTAKGKDSTPGDDDREKFSGKFDLDGAPHLNKGKNSSVKVAAWVRWQAEKMVKPNDTHTDLIGRIILEADKWGYESERKAFTVNIIRKMLPAGITGGRKKNGRK